MRYLYLTTFLLACFGLSAQIISDSLYFNNLEEESAFALEDKEDYFQLFSAIGNNNNKTVKSEYKKFLEYIEQLDKRYKGKKPLKRIKLLYDDIHEKYFIKYIDNPNFFDIFESKEYNCVTATGLFAIAFEHLSIP